MLSEINDKEDDLKEIWSYLRLCGKVLERNKFLTAAFKGCKPAPEGFHQKLVKYPWEYIFTLNIDDLVENIYRTAEIPLSVWDASNTTGTNYEHKTNLVKLHGSVNDSKNGYIFDSSEYKNFTIDSNSLLKEFAHQFLQHDLILIGTEFQEDDLQTVLDVYERSGYSKDPFHRFYISPNISTKLKLQIQNSPNDVWIKCDTKTFLDELDKVVSSVRREKLTYQKKAPFSWRILVVVRLLRLRYIEDSIQFILISFEMQIFYTSIWSDGKMILVRLSRMF